MAWEYVLAVVTAAASVASSAWAIKAIIKHEGEQCDERMEAFKEGLKHGEENR
jgi:hypothetical protein